MQKLGDYIREVDVRNKDLKVTNLLGLSMSKQFRPSTSNIVGVDLSNYKVVRNNVFAFDPMSVIRVHKVPIALNDTDFPIIVSPAYITFECIDVEKLDPKYLMMWFQRTEFDRYADFKSDAAVRGGYDWKELCETLIIIPSIEQQREIVSEYETISKRIKLNEQIIKNLEATAQTLYHKMFVEGIDKENLPEGWRIGTFTEVVKISGGGTPDTSEIMYWNGNIPFFTPTDSTNSYYCIKTEKNLSMLGFENCSSKIYKKDTTFVTARGTVGEITLASMDMAMNQSCYALLSNNKEVNVPYYIHQFAIETIASLKDEVVGAVFNALVTKDFEVKEVIIPSIEIMVEYNLLVKPLYQSILIRQKENSKLTELQSLLLAKMGQKKIDTMEEETFKSLYQGPFAEQIAFNIEQLNYRYNRLSEIDVTNKNNQKEYLMLFDSFIALFRALFLEKGKKQYSVQNYYREKGDDEIARKIDAFLDEKMFSWKNESIRSVLKFIADKFVCHIDPIEYIDLGNANFYMSQLANPYVDNNLKHIMDTISNIMRGQ